MQGLSARSHDIHTSAVEQSHPAAKRSVERSGKEKSHHFSLHKAVLQEALLNSWTKYKIDLETVSHKTTAEPSSWHRQTTHVIYTFMPSRTSRTSVVVKLYATAGLLCSNDKRRIGIHQNTTSKAKTDESDSSHLKPFYTKLLSAVI